MRKFLLGAIVAVAMACVFGGNAMADAACGGVNMLRENYPDGTFEVQYAGEWDIDYYYGAVQMLHNHFGCLEVVDYDKDNLKATFVPNNCSEDSNCNNRVEISFIPTKVVLDNFDAVLEAVADMPRRVTIEDINYINKAIEGGSDSALAYYRDPYLFSAELWGYLESKGLALDMIGGMGDSDEYTTYEEEGYAVRYGNIYVAGDTRVQYEGLGVVYVGKNASNNRESIKSAIKERVAGRSYRIIDENETIDVSVNENDVYYCGGYRIEGCNNLVDSYDVNIKSNYYDYSIKVVADDADAGDRVKNATIVDNDSDVSISFSPSYSNFMFMHIYADRLNKTNDEINGAALVPIIDGVAFSIGSRWDLTGGDTTDSVYYLYGEHGGVVEIGLPISDNQLDLMQNQEYYGGLSAYYIKDNGWVEKYDIEIRDGRAYFQTNHLGEFILATNNDSYYTANLGLQRAYPDGVYTLKYAGEYNDDYLKAAAMQIMAEVPDLRLRSYDFNKHEITFRGVDCQPIFTKNFSTTNDLVEVNLTILSDAFYEKHRSGYLVTYGSYCAPVGRPDITLRVELQQVNLPNYEEAKRIANGVSKTYYIDGTESIDLQPGWNDLTSEATMNKSSSFNRIQELKEYLQANDLRLYPIEGHNVGLHNDTVYHSGAYRNVVSYKGVFVSTGVDAGYRGASVIYIPEDTPNNNDDIVAAIREQLRRGSYRQYSYPDELEITPASEMIAFCGVDALEDNCTNMINAYETNFYGTDRMVFGVVRNSEKAAATHKNIVYIDSNTGIEYEGDNKFDYWLEATKENGVDSSTLSALKLKNAVRYDIDLVPGADTSAAWNYSIHANEVISGTIRIPIDVELVNKELLLYYMAEDGFIEECNFEVNEGVLSFHTDHLKYQDRSDEPHYAAGIFIIGEKTDDGWSGDTYLEDGEPVSGLREIDGETYYFDPATKQAQRGQRKIDGYWYYFDSNTKAMAKSKFITLSRAETNDGPKTVYYDKSGHMLYGFRTIGNNRYYLKNGSGALQKGHMKVDGYWYMFDSTTGAMKRGEFYTMQKGECGNSLKTVYFDNDGHLLYGLQDINGQTYYLKNGSGALQKGQQKIGSYWYYLDSNSGAMAKSEFITLSRAETNDGPKTVYYDKNGYMLYGIRNIGGNIYYLKKGSGALQKGHMKVDGYWYFFDKNTGVAKKSTFYTMQPGESGDAPKTVYFDANGHMLYGMQYINGRYYYFQKGSGRLLD